MLGISNIGTVLAVKGGDLLIVQHKSVVLDKVETVVVVIDPVVEAQTLIQIIGMVSNKTDVSYTIDLTSPTEILATQSNKKAKTKISFMVIS